MNVSVREQITSAYKRMAAAAGYRPAAPSDSFGGITVPVEKLNLEEEALKYAGRWWNEEEELSFLVGCCDYKTRSLTVFVIEAARLLCGGEEHRPEAAILLQLALSDLRELEKKGKKPDRNGIALSVRYAVMKRDRFCCALCGRSAKDVELEIDHILAVSRGGTDAMSNLRALCKDCNRGKGASE